MPDVKWWVSPFVDNGRNMDPSTRHTRLRYTMKKHAHFTRTLTPGFLRNVERQDIVVIDGHAMDGRAVLYQNEDTRDSDKREVDELVTLIRDTGRLPRRHVRIRMLACKSTTLARELAKALFPAYPHIAVAGYRYNIVQITFDTKRSLIEDPHRGDVRNTKDSGYVVWYDGLGNELPSKPRYQLRGGHHDDHFPFGPFPLD